MKHIVALSLLSLTYCFSPLNSEETSPLTYSPLEAPLYIQMNTNDGDQHLLKLSDGSFWILNHKYDTFWEWFSGKDAQGFWQKPDRIQLMKSENDHYPYILVNTDRNEMAEAKQIDPQTYFKKQTQSTLKESDSRIDSLYWQNTYNQLNN